MPMFYIPQPRRFRYQPRFFDPEKERREERRRQLGLASSKPDEDLHDLEYYERKVANLESPKPSKLTWRDMFRKREMPKFEYKPRFVETENGETENGERETENGGMERLEEAKRAKVRIHRRFEYDGQRRQQRVWVKVALAVMVLYIVYRYYGSIIQFLYSIFFTN